MTRKKVSENSVKYTVVLPNEDLNKLRKLTDEKVLTSVNAGIREAVGEYLINLEKKIYREQLLEAVKDENFIKRTDIMEDEFIHSDKEVEEMIKEW